MVYKIAVTHVYITLESIFIAFVGDLKVPVGLTSLCSPKETFRTAVL